MKDLEQYCPRNQTEWRQWLAANHEVKDAIWLIFYKKDSGKANLTWSEAVDEALCFGWIDSTKRSIDKEKYMQYFGKRKAESTWSKVNKEKIKVLTSKSLMTSAGNRCIEIAKQNGSWTILDSVENLTIPEDLNLALINQDKALAYFNGLSKSSRKSMLHWIVMAKRPETRKKRIDEIAECAQKLTQPKHFK